MGNIDDYRWIGEVDDWTDALDGLRPTGGFKVLGQQFTVPTRADYEMAFLQEGLIEPGSGLDVHREFVAVAQAHWHAMGENACVFAAHMSRLRDDNGWETYVLGDRSDPVADAESLAQLVFPRLMAPESEVVSVLVPHADDPAYIARLVRRLGRLPGWTLSDEGTENDAEHGNLVRVGLRVDVEFDFVSEVLGFGPYGAYGHTRRAPFTELAIRAKPPRKRRRDLRAFMAQVEIPGLETDEFGLWWDQTKANRAARLGAAHNERAKARVTVALPNDIWGQTA